MMKPCSASSLILDFLELTRSGVSMSVLPMAGVLSSSPSWRGNGRSEGSISFDPGGLYQTEQHLSLNPPVKRPNESSAGNNKSLHHYRPAQAKGVHDHELKSTSSHGENLVSTLAKGGNLREALQLFNTLPHRTVFSWTAVISGFTASGKGEEALKMYKCMLEEGVEPDEYSFVSLLKACGSIADLENGKTLHSEAWLKGFDSNIFVCSTLVSMYGKCGRITEAENVFGSSFQPAVVLWNAMISAYIEVSEGEKALLLYMQMQEEGVSLNERSFVNALQACCMLAENEGPILVGGRYIKVMSLEIGQALHADARKMGFDSDAFVCNTLVTMYGKCGTIAEAETVFVRSHNCSIVSWNAILSVYVEQGRGEKALRLYKHMQGEGISPWELTFVIVLQACCTLAEEDEDMLEEWRSIKGTAFEIGQALQVDAQMKNLNLSALVGNTLMNLYGKCGCILEAESVFAGLSERTVVSWTVMLSAYVEQGEAGKALRLYRQMQEDRVIPNKWTFVSALQACCTFAEREGGVVIEGQLMKVSSFEIGRALHADARKKGIDSDAFVGTTLVSMYGKCRSVSNAENVFCCLIHCNLVSWNAMLSAYIEQGQGEKTLHLFKQMQGGFGSQCKRAYLLALQACSMLVGKEDFFMKKKITKLMALDIGQALHADAMKKGFDLDAFMASSLVSMYGGCGRIMEAENVFGTFSHQHDVVSWTAMLSAYVEQGQGEKALWLYKRMQGEGVVVDDVTLVCFLQASCETGSLEICSYIHFAIVSAGYDMSPLIGGTLIHAYGNCASIVDAQAVFNALTCRDRVSWSALIGGYARVGNYLASLEIFEKMQQEAGIKPDGVAFLAILSACNHAGLVDKGIEYFEYMTKHYGIQPELEHYASLMDLLGRAGDLIWVKNMLSRIPLHLDLAIWLSLLGACRKHGNLELGRQVFEHVVCLQPNQDAAYILMYNIYADAGLWAHANQVENARQKGG